MFISTFIPSPFLISSPLPLLTWRQIRFLRLNLVLLLTLLLGDMASSSCAVVGVASTPLFKLPPPPASASADTPSRGSAFFASSADSLSTAISSKRNAFSKVQARKRMFDDPFYFGEDPDLTYGDLLSEGKQDVQDPRPPTDSSSDKGWLSFPQGYLPEIASLGLYIRDDVRRCVLLVSGGVYENLLFFPVIQLLKAKYPGVRIDVAASPRGKQTYETNKYVRRAWSYDIDDPYVSPADYTEFLGKLKNECYDLVLSTKPAGIGHAMLLFLTDARQRVSYIIPNVNGAGAGAFLSSTIKADNENLAEAGYSMYKNLEEFLCAPIRDVEELSVPPLEVAVPKKVKEIAKSEYEKVGVKAGQYIVVHGIESLSQASMRSLGDPDSSLSVAALNYIAKSSSQDVLVVVPNDKDNEKVYNMLGPDAHVIKITTPGKLAAVIDDAFGVVTTNTAALQFSLAMKKPTIALFGSEESAKKFLPPGAENVTVITSETSRLSGIELNSVSTALAALEKSALAVA